MKKTLKISSYLLIIACAISLALCFIIIPERTRYDMDIVVEWLNKPLFIICGTTITLGLVITIIVKLVYDRHKEKLVSQYEKTIAIVKEKEDKAKEYYDKALKVNEETKVFLGGYREELEMFKDLLVKVCSTSPNAKIKALGYDIQNTYEYKKKETIAQVEKCETDIGNFVKEKTDIGALEQQVKDLSAKLESLVEKYEREETTND